MDNIPSCTLTDSKKPCFQSYCANLKNKIVSWAVWPSPAQGDLPATRLWVGQILHIYSLGTQSDGACHVVSSLFLTRREANYCCKPYSDLTVVLLHSPLLPWSKCQSSEVTLWRHQCWSTENSNVFEGRAGLPETEKMLIFQSHLFL